MCSCLREPSWIPNPPWQPAAADHDLSSSLGEGCVSPHQLLLDSVDNSSPPLTTTAPPPDFHSPPLDFNSPLNPSPAALGPRPPASSNTQTPARPSQSPDVQAQTCDHAGCHFPADNVPALVRHIRVAHPSPHSIRLFCGRKGCEDVKDERSLVRHLNEKHFGLVYTCRCGDAHRKDGHRRHLRKCASGRSSPYVCVCGKQTHDKKAHQAHFEGCGGKRTRGRPRKESGTKR